MEELLIAFAIIATSMAHTVVAPSLLHPPTSSINKITDVNATCDLSSFNITVLMEQPFKGLLFAKDFSNECHASETLSYSLSLYLPTSGCGIRLSSKANSVGEDIYYVATLVIQQDRFLQQATDLEYTVKCLLQKTALSVKSKPMKEAFKKILRHKQNKNIRTGRMKGMTEETTDSTGLEYDLNEALAATKAWMEILPEQDNGLPGVLQVGEPSLLIVKSTLPVGIGWKIIDCIAHDGLGDSSQKLLDQNGCPLDELLLPAPLMGPSKSIALMRHQEVVSKFSAFKFPDRERLHLSCGLQICKGSCEMVDCNSANSTAELELRLGRTLAKNNHGEILDRLEVFNSVEVIAPSIELEEFRNDNWHKGNDIFTTFGRLPGDKTFCVSSDKMAITFALLGLIFLFAVIVAIGALMKARRSGSTLSHYSKSLFSSSSSGSRFGGSKLLLHDNPLIRQPYSGVPYGRVF